MASRSGAGAAVSSGASFQARVGGYIIVTGMCDTHNELVPSGKVLTLGFETTESIDDINIETAEGDGIYIQAKAKIDYSLSDAGQLRSVICQFCSQQKRDPNPREKFVLVTSSRSSKKIVYDLRTALDTFRMSPEFEFFRDQPKALTSIILDLRDVIKKLIDVGNQLEVKEFVEKLIRKISVIILDVEEGDPIEQSLILILSSQNFVPAAAVWGKIVSDCITHSKGRHTLDIRDAAVAYDKFRTEAIENESPPTDEFIQLEMNSMDFSVGKEVVLCRVEEGSTSIPLGLVILELYRFSDDCSERISFSENAITLPNGLRFPLLRRAATVQGLMRIIDADPSIIGGKQVTVCPIDSGIDFEVGLCADSHREKVKTSIQENERMLRCLHCGSPVWEEEINVIEMEPIEKLIVGVSHGRCLVPKDRIIGRLQSELFRTYPELVNFDINAWFRASHGGQIAFCNAESIRTRGTRIIGWGGLNPKGPVGQYVVEMSLSGGGHEIVTQRNGVHRFSKPEAEDFVSKLNISFSEARKQLDPFCYTDQSKMFLITYRVPWKGTVPQRVRIPPGKLSLQPVAIGADDGGNDIVRSTSV